MKLLFTEQGWNDYVHHQEHDRKLLARLNALLRDCTRSPFSGIGKPEPLRGDLSGWWSRRISDEHRLVYRVRDDQIEIAQCRFHYRK